MNKLSISIITFCLFITATVSHAEMYKWVDAEGNISYSDQPPFKGADKLDPPSINTTPAVETPPKAAAKEAEEETDTKYSFFKITSPENDATIRNNEGNFSISLGISPALDTANGHYLTILLDGKPVHKNITSTSASFSNIDRGTHKITATVKNSQGKALITASAVTVHIHRQSVLQKSPR